MKKLCALITSLCLMLSVAIPVNASNNYVFLNGFEIKYNGVVYDLSTREGNYNLVFNNQNMSSEEYMLILSQLYSTNEKDYLQEFNENQGIELLELVPNDPGVGGSIYEYHSYMKWFYRDDDGWNLGVAPYSSTKTSLPKIYSGWAEVVEYQKSNVHWYNEDSLKGQYLCHYWFAPATKTQWNIAPSIPNKSAFEWVVDKCN